MTVSSIEWTDRTWNPVRGCTRVSEGCRNCYAETFAARNLPGMRSPTTGKPFATMRRETLTGLIVPGTREAERVVLMGARWTGAVELITSMLDEPLRWKKPQRVFVNSMSDLFHEALPFEAVAEIFERMSWGFRLNCRKAAPCDCECEHDPEAYGGPGECPCWSEVTQHTYQILTKRPARMLAFFAWLDEWAPNSERTNGETHAPTLMFSRSDADWPLPNVWLGVSVEDQATADERIPLLLQTPAAVRFVSYEPALGPVDFEAFLQFPPLTEGYKMTFGNAEWRGLDWIIVGGESGPGARPFDVEWARSTVRQCKAAGVPVFVKQLGARPELHARQSINQAGPGWKVRVESLQVDTTIALRDRKGGDPAEWPEDLRIRQFPKENA